MSKTEIEITPELLADLKDKAKKATPGPYIAYKETFSIYAPSQKHDFIEIPHCKNREENLEYIATANPSVILALIERIEWLEREYAYSMRFSY